MRTVLFLVFLLLPAVANAQIHMWTDEHGVVRMGDRPPGDVDSTAIGYEKFSREEQRQASERQRARDRAAYQQLENERRQEELEKERARARRELEDNLRQRMQRVQEPRPMSDYEKQRLQNRIKDEEARIARYRYEENHARTESSRMFRRDMREKAERDLRLLKDQLR